MQFYCEEKNWFSIFCFVVSDIFMYVNEFELKYYITQGSDI